MAQERHQRDRDTSMVQVSASNSSIHDGEDLEQQRTRRDDDSPNLEPSHTTQSKIEPPKTLLNEVAFVFILCMSQLMTQAGLGQSIAPLHIIGKSFGIQSPGELSWFPAGYSLTVGTFILPAGRLGDLYGHKKMVIIGFAWYALWSLLAGFSVYSSRIFFDCCRAFQGMGPALLLPNSIAILGRTYPPGPRKAMVFSLFGATAPSGFVVGAVFSSLLAQKLWWPWAFWIMAIVLVILSVLGSLVIPNTPPPNLDDSDSAWSRIDALGGLTGVIGLVLLNFAWNQAPVVGWQTPYIYSLLIVAFIFIGIFGFVETRIAKFPLIPSESMKVDTCFVLACVAFGWASFGIWIFYFWQFLEELRGITPLLASAQFIPTAVSGFCAAVTTGLILGRMPGSVVMMIALLAFTVGLVLLATAPVGQTYWAQTFVSLIIMPWGMDMSFPAANLLLSNQMAKEHQGVSASLVNTVINYSISIALGIAGTVETHIDVGGTDLLKGYRAAWYLAIGLAGSGTIIAGLYGANTWRTSRKVGKAEGDKVVDDHIQSRTNH